jgi:hypothetical protein
MKNLFLVLFLIVLSSSLAFAREVTRSSASANEPFFECLAAYMKKAGPYASYVNNNTVTPYAIYTEVRRRDTPLLSYRGPRVISYYDTTFETLRGKLKKTVQEVSEEEKVTELNAALVAEFLKQASGDDDSPANQLMAIQLQSAYPKVKDLDGFNYWALVPLKYEGAQVKFCENGKLWTWKQIRQWLRDEMIPKLLIEKPDHVSNADVCQQTQTPEGPTLCCQEKYCSCK